MGEIAGFRETELESIVQKLGRGGSVRVFDEEGRETTVTIEVVDPARCGPNTA